MTWKTINDLAYQDETSDREETERDKVKIIHDSMENWGDVEVGPIGPAGGWDPLHKGWAPGWGGATRFIRQPGTGLARPVPCSAAPPCARRPTSTR
jgi:hypothetical protein